MQVALSIIIPVKDEGENIDILGNEINMAMENVTLPWECIWIDDGSTDTTVGELKKLSACDARHRLVILARNFGQSAALSVGFQNATGDILVTLDGDGQNDPADIPRLIEKLQKHGADMVNGVRQKRHDSFIRKISSRIANNFRDWVTGDSVTDVGCSVRVFKRECVKGIPVFKGMHRFLPTLVRMQGYTHIMESLVNHRPRVRGKTKYGIQNRLWVGLADLAAVKWMQSRLVFPEVQSMTSTTRREGEE
ncbi:MAG TPA: glycosyltransferase family 2 protein [Syntrophorhabdus sp.]|jgi:glycosyltransferase involved in cell wall biosynthesis|nr:glycosyltransferase family 2 protein [Syntrophorhabdus sp.]HQG25216.1 glycosyltransferase family 2 protein [Syntrophorhabdus sp.]HQH82349.1 glycosyltransferase family 2 protein [Syntrophorhabdus sp.]HQI95675.1 glycosyltransferase family 2 protein [Syntrophorhabdus sp.]HQM25746.1 glycosyltransferase family 2 protein [Syntrophorhabdus sp.]